MGDNCNRGICSEAKEQNEQRNNNRKEDKERKRNKRKVRNVRRMISVPIARDKLHAEHARNGSFTGSADAKRKRSFQDSCDFANGVCGFFAQATEFNSASWPCGETVRRERKSNDE